MNRVQKSIEIRSQVHIHNTHFMKSNYIKIEDNQKNDTQIYTTMWETDREREKE